MSIFCVFKTAKYNRIVPSDTKALFAPAALTSGGGGGKRRLNQSNAGSVGTPERFVGFIDVHMLFCCSLLKCLEASWFQEVSLHGIFSHCFHLVYVICHFGETYHVIGLVPPLCYLWYLGGRVGHGATRAHGSSRKDTLGSGIIIVVIWE